MDLPLRRLAWISMLIVVPALGGCSASSQRADRTHGREVIEQREAFTVSDLGEVAALADLVVEGSVTERRRGPASGLEQEGIGYDQLTIAVDQTYLGTAEQRTVKVLVVGWNPRDGRPQRTAGQHVASPGSRGIWFLNQTHVPDLGDAYFVTTSAGQLLRGSDGTALTGGDQEAAAVACHRTWDDARSLIIRSTRDRPPKPKAGLLIAPEIRSADGVDGFAGNPCSSDAPSGSGV